ncbi:hypothetical protein SAMN06265795_104287 [Noviherbaspirillum humi]|uniref:Uncharacterized protein n=1 Tax=Noviherbaspirillum humi TaxID=1688639 RepID=A0A239G740_9BURK|nr:hypothetical protein [Noviherbaspirillum humi]SNS65156.1 hypothetical protein SAMN06265795_104287 [Noviherbaspirillum humi]
MTIPTLEYRGFLLSAYSQKLYPTHNDPYASGPRRFSAVVRIDSSRMDELAAQRYQLSSTASFPDNSDKAIDLAMEYGRDIIDGRVQALPLN